MSQFDYGTIDPNSKSGPQLALDLNQFRDALNSGHRGASRPPYARSGMSWVQEVSGERWDLMMFDGATDHLLRSINPQTGKPLPIPQESVQGLVELSQVLEKNTAPMVGSTAAAAGKKGLVPVPPAGDSERYLSADGTFRAVNKTTLGLAAIEATQAAHSVRVSALESSQVITRRWTAPWRAMASNINSVFYHGMGREAVTFHWEAQITTSLGGWPVGTVLKIQPDPEVNYAVGLTVYASSSTSFTAWTTSGVNIAIVNSATGSGSAYLPFTHALFRVTVTG